MRYGSPDAGLQQDDRVGAVPSADDTGAELSCLKAALDQLAIMAVTDRAGRITYVNDLFCRISGYSRDELIGSNHRILNSSRHPREFFQDMWKTISTGKAWHDEICNKARDGTFYWVDTTVVPNRDASGAITGYVSIRYDITKRKEAEAALIEENARREKAEFLLRDVIEALPNGVSAYDAEDRLILCNSAFKESHPLAAPAIVEGATFESIVRYGLEQGQFVQAGQSEASRKAWLERRMNRHRNLGGRPVVHQIHDGRWFQVQERRSKGGYSVGVRTDITKVKQAELLIKEQAERDPLTGLYNRRVVLHRLRKALCQPGGQCRNGALVLVDLDGFKDINDRFGHDGGDKVLLHVAKRFQSIVRRNDLVARLGGDEFALILCDIDAQEDAVRVVNKLLTGMREPVKLGQKSVTPSGSFGIALFPQHGAKPSDVMKHADMALYEAKRNGRTTYAMFTAHVRRDLYRRSALTEALRLAIDADQLQVALQPQIGFSNQRHSGFEALLRWRRDGKPVSAAETIALAEQSGLIIPLGQQVFRKAFSAFRKLAADGLEVGSLAVNVAAAQLRDSGFAAGFLELVERHGLDAGNIEVEVTENVVIDRASDSVERNLRDLGACGVRIALDDFGTGYASLSHLKRFPIGRLKIDRSFVKDIVAKGEDAAITRAIISLAHSLGIEVVAEGVETEEQFRMLSNYGCDHAQGFLIGRPMSPAEAEAYLRRPAGRACIQDLVA